MNVSIFIAFPAAHKLLIAYPWQELLLWLLNGVHLTFNQCGNLFKFAYFSFLLTF